MRRTSRTLPSLLVWLLALPVVPVWAGSLSDFPQIAQPRLSADGSHLALIQRDGDHWRLRVRNLDQGSDHVAHQSSQHRIDSLLWLNDQRLLLTLSRPGITPWLLAVERNGRTPRPLTADHHLRHERSGPVVVDTLPGDGVHFISSVDDDIAWQPRLYRINAYTGERELLEENQGRTWLWMTDRRGRPRLRADYAPAPHGVSYTWFWRPAAEAPWRPFFSHQLGAASLLPLGFDLDNRHLIVSADLDEPTLGLYRYDPHSAEIQDLIYRHPAVDITLFRTGRKGQPAMVSLQSELPDEAYLDTAWQRWGRQLDRQLPDTHNRIVSVSADERRLIVLAYSDRDPGSYHLYQPVTGELRLLARRMPGLDPATMVTTRPVTIPARDGLALSGYLTAPRDRSSDTPLVIYVHGGPWLRDTWGFDPLVQLLTQSGMAVLKVNYRGSRGFGRDFLMAGRQQWGKAMQDDLLDALEWARTKGYGRDGRACLLGMSYGGYAALTGVLRDHQHFRCAVAVAPVTDLSAQIEAFRQAGNLRGYAEWISMVGDPADAMDDLPYYSPLHHAEKLSRPVLLVHGEQDRTVSIRHSRAFYERARAAGAPAALMEFPDDDHRLSRSVSRRLMFDQTVDFLDRHLEGKHHQPGGSGAVLP